MNNEGLHMLTYMAPTIKTVIKIKTLSSTGSNWQGESHNRFYVLSPKISLFGNKSLKIEHSYNSNTVHVNRC